MPLRRLSLCLLSLCGTLACARPSLEDVPPLEFGPVADAAVEASQPLQGEPDSEAPRAREDAAVPMVGEDASSACPDADQDGICDADDNCPDDTNRDQADADDDGTGDVCEILEVKCDGDQLETGAISNSATLARMMINGTSDRVVKVRPGEKVAVSFSLTFNDCGTFSFQQVFLGVESETPTCQPTGCTSGIEIPLPYEFEVEAPAKAGLHYLLAGIQAALSPVSCSSGSSRPDAGTTAAKRVAALCVSNK